jgi:hypothetical protein
MQPTGGQDLKNALGRGADSIIANYVIKEGPRRRVPEGRPLGRPRGDQWLRRKDEEERNVGFREAEGF